MAKKTYSPEVNDCVIDHQKDVSDIIEIGWDGWNDDSVISMKYREFGTYWETSLDDFQKQFQYDEDNKTWRTK